VRPKTWRESQRFSSCYPAAVLGDLSRVRVHPLPSSVSWPVTTPRYPLLCVGTWRRDRDPERALPANRLARADHRVDRRASSPRRDHLKRQARPAWTPRTKTKRGSFRLRIATCPVALAHPAPPTRLRSTSSALPISPPIPSPTRFFFAICCAGHRRRCLGTAATGQARSPLLGEASPAASRPVWPSLRAPLPVERRSIRTWIGLVSW